MYLLITIAGLVDINMKIDFGHKKITLDLITIGVLCCCTIISILFAQAKLKYTSNTRHDSK
jgi:hypothetical protein